MNSKREAKLKRVAQHRQHDLSVILENVHDTHNIGAVMRTCDSIGIKEIFVINSRPLRDDQSIILGKRTSGGTRKWIDVHFYHDLPACITHVRSKYNSILGTHLTADAKELYDLDLTQSVALLFGNEHKGLSPEALACVDGNFAIPQVGMVESLNISVACAVSLYEAYRQRKEAGKYELENRNAHLDEITFQDYKERHKKRQRFTKVPRIK